MTRGALPPKRIGNCPDKFRSATPETELQRLIKMVMRRDLASLPSACQRRHHDLQVRVRQTRYEDAATGVALIAAVRTDRAAYDLFAEAFEQELGREAKADWLEREAFVYLYGEARKDIAGTDALALADAIRRGIAPEDVPGYIQARGGLDKLLRAERNRRDPFVDMTFKVPRSMKDILNKLDSGEYHGGALILKAHNKNAPVQFALMKSKR